MKRLACLVIVAASSLPCAASDPNRPDPRQNVMMRPKLQGPNTPPPAPPKMLDDETVRAFLFPFATYADRVSYRIWLDRLMTKLGCPARKYGPLWPLLD